MNTVNIFSLSFSCNTSVYTICKPLSINSIYILMEVCLSSKWDICIRLCVHKSMNSKLCIFQSVLFLIEWNMWWWKYVLKEERISFVFGEDLLETLLQKMSGCFNGFYRKEYSITTIKITCLKAKFIIRFWMSLPFWLNF